MGDFVWRLPVILAAFLALTSAAAAQQCKSALLCRAPDESNPASTTALLHNPNSAGNRIWTTACGPNSDPPRVDKTCQEIASCPAAGGFGKFLLAVTNSCKQKHFDGYFGLDGMTFGILDWTSDNLPNLLQAYSRRSPDSFNETLGPLKLPMTDGCLDTKWTCDNNRQGKLMCDASFHQAFSNAVKTGEFQKAQAEVALAAYERRLATYQSLGLKTEYGNVAMAVVANNLRRGDDCKPATWKAACSSQADEVHLVDCMLDQYVQHECRGSRRGSESRRAEIKALFTAGDSSGIPLPTAEAVMACSANWGKQ